MNQKPEFQYVDDHFDELVLELQEAVRQPSIAAQNVGMNETATHFKELLESHGISARLIPTDGGYPVVYGEIRGAVGDGGDLPTVLFYDHYDVQPPDPLDEWASDPFSGEIRDGKMYARGVSDNKGHACSRIQGIGSLLRLRDGQLPVNVKFLIEGEEEIGSPHLAQFLRDNQELLRADCGVWESGYMGPDGRPGMYLGVKGILYVELEACGAERDMHSGAAASVPNPAWRLIWALSTIKNEAEEVLIPGFYDDVLPPSERELELLRADVEAREAALASIGGSQRPRRGGSISIHSPLLELEGLELRKRALFSPTANVCGFRSGYLGEGQKTVLPSRALVKMDFRLVPNQDPKDILTKLEAHLVATGFDDITVHPITMDHPAKTSVDHPVVEAAQAAALAVYGKPASIAPTQGGSGPMYPFQQYLNLPMVSFGVGYWGSGNHGPNENIRLDDYRQGIKLVMEFVDRVGATLDKGGGDG